MSVINFPGREPDRDELHAEAFRDLEPVIHDCVTMSDITAQCMNAAQCNDEKLAFSVFHLHEMLLSLQQRYRAAWDGRPIPDERIIPARSSKEIKEQFAGDDPPQPIA
jgi:hypothetical protein